MALGQGPQALLTTLYRSTDCLCRRGAAMKNLAQSASPHAGENNAPLKPGTKQVMAAARANRVGVMGIRAVQAGALTAAIDRPLPTDHPEVRDYERAAGFRRLADELGDDPAILAHRYALSLDIDTLVLGVKNRQELAGCVAAAEAGPLSKELIDRIDRVAGRTPPS